VIPRRISLVVSRICESFSAFSTPFISPALSANFLNTQLSQPQRSRTPFCADCAPRLGDAEAEASGRILRFEVPANRQAYDTDLRDFRTKLSSSLKEMQVHTLAYPGLKTDILGSIALAEQEFQSGPKNDRKQLALLSDLIQDSSSVHFASDKHQRASKGGSSFRNCRNTVS
jgi:hypothetical protein